MDRSSLPSDPFAAPPPFGPVPAVRRRNRAFAIGGFVLGLLLVAGTMTWMVHSSAPMRAEAQHYLDDLNAGNVEAAYQQWCPQDREQYSLAEFRAQREDRVGEHGHVVGTFWSTDGDRVSYRTDQGPGVAHVAQVGGHWYICPKGAALVSAMENCSCMSPAQHLEADVAGVIRENDMTAPLSAVRCPTLPRLVDAEQVTCRAEAVNGARYTVVATESHNTTYTNVRVISGSEAPGSSQPLSS